MTNASGGVVQSLAYDAWGLRRNPATWAASLGSPFGGTQPTKRGYTGHEHLDNVELIHMNGRVQDPRIGAFISADPFVQALYASQSLNRYSYVWNNPMLFVDPSGFKCEKPGDSDCTPDDLRRLECLQNPDCTVVDVWGSRSGEGRSAPAPGVQSYGYDRGYAWTGGEQEQEAAATGTSVAASSAATAQLDVDIGSVISGSATAVSVPAGLAELSGLTRAGSNGRLYLETARGGVFRGNQHVTTISLAKMGKFAGAGAAGATLAVDAHALGTGKIGWGKAAADTTVIAASALVGGPFGVGLSLGYFGGDAVLQIRDQNNSVMEEWCARNGNSC